MTTEAERLAGFSYADCDIDTSRCRPGAKNCKTVCPSCAPTAKHQGKRDLSVDLEKGQWHCFNPGCEWKSGLILERREREGSKLAPNARRTPNMTPTPTHTPSVAPTPSKSTPVALPDRELRYPSTIIAPWALQWLDDRGIPESVARQLDVLSNEDNRVDHPRNPTIMFPYINRMPDGKLRLANIKYRSVESKKFWQESADAGAIKCLYNLEWFVANPNFESVVICEGEMDVLSCAVAGWPNATTVPDGAQAKIDTLGMTAFDEPQSAGLMEVAKRIYIAVDNDAAGIAYRNVLIEKFGPQKCYVVHWPDGIKDANEMLLAHGAPGLDQALSAARPVDLPGIHDFHQDIPKLHEIYHGGYDKGASTGWPEVDQIMQWFPGMVYAWTGIPGHGKTTFLTNALANVIYLHGWKVGLFSPEMGPNSSVLRKLTQVAANSPILPTARERLGWEHIEDTAQWVADRVFRVDAVRTDGENVAALTFDELLDRFTQLVVRSGINVAVIDPWIRIDAMRPRGFTETEWIANCLNKITRWSQRHQVSFVVVNHPRKQETGKSGEDEGWVSPYEMMGSAYWFALADFIIGVKRDKYGPSETRDHTYIRTWKVREEGYQGELGIREFTFNRDSQRFYALNTPHPIGVGTGAYADLPSNLRIVRSPEYQPEPEPEALPEWEQAPWEEVYEDSYGLAPL
jgi:twinkle protein